MNFNNEYYRSYMSAKQYRFSERDEFIAQKYGDKLTYNEIVELKYLALREILIKYNIDVITDLPWGKGFVEYRNRWEMLMKETIEARGDK